ncbi:S1C family serine protease [Cohnella zeiphila]|uniref:Trypsin-like peptidase domain-containing protein n=1 Tax=Cohnella zeiphila TaxID=2761120 RepID=A0A7X0VW68_9BACL|nr:trypsin-like peptidase domain-containing protein [Cohnella zeiphila]MBB6730643.1 trypsin-like peptidase domain-containing protein [Cohnella zeiphila]
MEQYNQDKNPIETNNRDNRDERDEPMTVYRYDSSNKLMNVRSAYEEELASADRAADGPNRGNRGKRPGGMPLKTMLASFLVGALVVGGLSFMSDRMNLFTGGASSAIESGGNSYSAALGLTTASLSSGENNASVFDQANPAVVEIENYGNPSDQYGANLFGGRGGWMGRQQLQQQQQSSEPELVGTGTGFFIDKSGYILTNQHVIADATELKVTVPGYDGKLTAKVVNADEQLDLAVLKVESPDGKDFPALTLGDSDQTKVGDEVIAIGNPYGLDHTMTIGILSAKERPITIQEDDGTEHPYEHLLQTDAAINPGNSGGPLLNAQGEVIGMNTAVNAEAQGIGFAISSATIQNALKELMSGTTNLSF